MMGNGRKVAGHTEKPVLIMQQDGGDKEIAVFSEAL